jgi:hypothetical protein
MSQFSLINSGLPRIRNTHTHTHTHTHTDAHAHTHTHTQDRLDKVEELLRNGSLKATDVPKERQKILADYPQIASIPPKKA